MRNKRLLDVGFSIFYLFVSPLLMWFVDCKGKSISNAFQVLFGKKSWVGYKNCFDLKLPKIKKGVLCPDDKKGLNDHQYAKDYSVLVDVQLLFSNFKYLGN